MDDVTEVGGVQVAMNKKEAKEKVRTLAIEKVMQEWNEISGG